MASCIAIANQLEQKGIHVAVVSLPCLEGFFRQDKEYIDSVLFLPREKRISVEMASTFGWGDLAAYHLGIDEFGLSGKQGDVIAHYKFDEASLSASIEKIVC